MAEQLTIKDVEKVFDDKLKPIVKHFNERMDKSDERMDKMDERFDKIDERFDKLENRMVKVEILIENDISKKIDLIIEILNGVIEKQERHDKMVSIINDHEDRLLVLEEVVKRKKR